ncbi:MAG: primosomal protein N', partial [Candidatus Hydrogenedentes bacterium]|nr:primosomal protein N' [Candidatus Hydrogenedentota bacterium]
MPGNLFAHVALPVPVDHPFTYEVPVPFQDRIKLGMRAVVPIQKRVDTGYIVGLHDTTDLEKVRSILDVPDLEPVVSKEMIQLCTWIADYYCCSLGEALQCAVPSGIHQRTSKRYTLLHDRLTSGRFSDGQRQIVAALHRLGPLEEARIAKEVGEGGVARDLLSLERRGILLAERLSAPAAVNVRMETWALLNEDAVLPVEQQIALQRRAPKQAAIYLDLLRNEPEQPVRELCQKHGATTAAVRALEEKELITRQQREAYRVPLFNIDERAREKHALNAEQQSAFDAIRAALEAGAFQTFLLHGITGSGKTEVYLQVIEHTLEQGKDAIVLVPEISLTPQTVGRFLARFETQIAVLHSGLSPGERYDEWRRAQRGEVRIVVGARSAIFAPLPNLGIVVVDEEHDASYKQGDVPRYHARDVAIMRANMNNAVCVLGSATPSIESHYNSEAGKSTRLVLNERATRSALPEVQLIDMREEAREVSGEIILSRKLESAIQQRVEDREQVILLLNRRGHSPFVLCPQCGWCAECDHCNVTMTHHAKGHFLSCHYCNARRDIPLVCDECHFNPLVYLGAGTQKIEDYLLRAFSDARVERMDRDTTSTKGGHAKILRRFGNREIDILIGTQMIAKGHDYPSVTLVGVINADTGLGLPDFRAAENVFQLLTQVAGRAGRGDKPGQVLIQTYRPNHYAVQAAKNHDYAAFYAHEIEQRRKAGYPPFRRMVNFAIECTDLLEAERAAMLLHRTAREQIDALGFQGIELLGPAPATIHRVKNKYRWNLGAFSNSAKRLNALTRALRTATT